MRLPMAFTPIEIGETDTFVFDFTPEVGSAAIIWSYWSCVLAPFQTASDPSPQERILATALKAAIQTRSPSDGSLQTRTGAFAVAKIGGFPTSAAGATYILEATIGLNDGRILKLDSTVQCTEPNM